MMMMIRKDTFCRDSNPDCKTLNQTEILSQTLILSLWYQIMYLSGKITNKGKVKKAF
jgi:hypothetical protein